MDLGLKGKVVVVTGGRGAIGAATANCFADEGARVIIADKLRDKSEEERVYGTSGGVQYFRYLDLTDALSIESFVDGTLREFRRVDVLVNNAAIFNFGPVEAWAGIQPLEDHISVGLLGPVRLIQELWRCAPDSKSGSIVNISSVAGHVGEPDAFAYTPVKAAQKGLTLSCAIEMAPYGGWAVAVSPGHTWSPAHEARLEGLSRTEYERSSANIASTLFGRFLEPREVGEIIVIAASRLGKVLSGQDLKATFGIEAGGFNLSYRTHTGG